MVSVIVAGSTPLQLVAVAAVVMAGAGLTVTLIVVGDPVQPAAETGVTIYGTVPVAVLLPVLVRGVVGMSEVPQPVEHGTCPVTVAPVAVPSVHV